VTNGKYKIMAVNTGVVSDLEATIPQGKGMCEIPATLRIKYIDFNTVSMFICLDVSYLDLSLPSRVKGMHDR